TVSRRDELMPSRRRPDPALSIYPHQVHIGDRVTDADTDGVTEWEVVSRPVTFKKGHEVRARVQRPENPTTSREKYWAAHEKIQVRRNTLNRAATMSSGACAPRFSAWKAQRPNRFRNAIAFDSNH